MKLSDVPAGGVTYQDLAVEDELVRDLQLRLGDFGLVDPPEDGNFGPVSQQGLSVFGKLVGETVNGVVTQSLAQALVNTSSASLLPINEGNDFAGRIVKYMRSKGYWIARGPGYLNIVYVEGANEDGSPNVDAPDVWNDRRIVITIKNGKPVIVGHWEGTTEPGYDYTMNPMNPGGAARIAFGQYKAWSVGIHNAGKPSGHEALRQVGNIIVHRDRNKDFKRTNDMTDVGSSFAINQHHGYNKPPSKIGNASAGCLVGRTKDGHREFMALVKTDPRYVKGGTHYKFITTVIAGDDLADKFPL